MLSGFGCRILAYDKFPNEEVKKYATYVDGPTFARESDIITLHCPLTPETRHILNEETLPYLKDGVFIINTSRGALLDTAKVIQFLKSGKIGYLAHLRPWWYRRRRGSLDGYRFVSGLPAVGTLFLVAGCLIALGSPTVGLLGGLAGLLDVGWSGWARSGVMADRPHDGAGWRHPA